MSARARLEGIGRSVPQYDATPKAVFAAVALSLAMRLSEDDPEQAIELLRGEWQTLYRSGLVPQRPPGRRP